VEEEEARTLDARLEDLRALLALRWYYEMIAEKNCVLVAGFATRFVVLSPHTLGVHVQIMVIFLVCEVVSDLVTGYVMETKLGVPFSRVPRPKGMRRAEFWFNEIMLSLVTVCTCLAFYHAQAVSKEVWFP
jgi:hypothetical protein